MYRKKLHFCASMLFFISSIVNAHVGLDYPSGGEVFSPGTTVGILWTELVPHDTENWDLFYSSDGGTTWDTIMMDIPYDTTMHHWTVPPEITTQGLVRVRQDNPGQDYESTSGVFTVEIFLAVELTDFDVARVGDEVQINWQTNTETGNEWFEIEKGFNPLHFSVLERLAGAGYSSVPLRYHFIDSAFRPGTIYYRIKSISSDGKADYSKVKSILIEAESAISPNPTDGMAWITNPKSTHWQLLNFMGQTVLEIICDTPVQNSNPCLINLSAFAPGIYFLRSHSHPAISYPIIKW